MSDTISPRLANALSRTFQLFATDARRGTTVPVLSHLLSVCALVQQDGGDEDEAIAALLHDVLEDKPDQMSATELDRSFGQKVLRIVNVCTDTPPAYAGGPKPPWIQRKTAYLARVANEPPELLRVTVADKVDNLRAILADHRHVGDRIWSRFNAGKEHQLWYYRSARDNYKSAGFKGPLMEELDRLVAELRAIAE